MKKLSPLLMFFCLAGFFANAQLQIDPVVPEDSTVANVICLHDSLDWYRIITPINGMLVIYTTASVPDSGSPEEFQYLGFEVLGKNLNGAFGEVYQGGNAAGAFYPYVGNEGVPLPDTSYTCCLAADTFFIRVDESLIANTCWSYTFHWHTIPATYANNPLPDSFPAHAQPMPYNTSVTGNLGFEDISGGSADGTNDWIIVPPMDGTIKINVSVEGESEGGHYMTIDMLDHNLQGFVAGQYPPAGPFQSPIDSNIYWECISAGDTFYIETYLGTFGDGGYSYRMSYTMIPPVYNADTASNFSFGTAQVVNPSLPIEDHSSFYYSGTNVDEFFKFYLPDTGILTLRTWIESSNTLSPGAYVYMYLYDSTESPVNAGFYPVMGGNSVPLGDTNTVDITYPGWYYLRMQHSSSCYSYQIGLSGAGITTAIAGLGASIPLAVFPNPSASTYTVDFGNARNTTINIYNSLGQLVETDLQENERYATVGQKLTPGIYLLKATNKDGETVGESKLVKTN
jgi:hypothetical protein